MSNDSDVEIIGESSKVPTGPKTTDDDDIMIIEDMGAPTKSEVLSYEMRRKLAEEKREEGNLAYTSKKYHQALKLYSMAIELCPNVASYYNNRSACYMMLGEYDKALTEARTSVARDPNYLKGHVRVARCCLSLADTVNADAALSTAESLPDRAYYSGSFSAEWRQLRSLKRLLIEVSESVGMADWRRVLFLCNLILKQAPGSSELRARRAESLALLGRIDEAQSEIHDLLRSDVNNVEALYVRSLCLYMSGNDDDVRRSCQFFQHLLRLSPDHQRAKTAYKRAKELSTKKEEGSKAFREGRLDEALQLYLSLLEVDADNVRSNSKLHFNIATVLSRKQAPKQSLEHCNKAIELSPEYLKAYLRRAKCYMELEQYEEAVRDYQKVLSMEHTDENRQLLSNAKLELKKSKRKDLYKVLGVGKQATEDEIKKAYRKQALTHHPDRHASANDEERRVQEQKFKEVGEAYSVLSNKEKRHRYDNGHDLEELNGGSAADTDVNDVFQRFFGGGAGPGMRFSRNMGQGFQFPGGGSFQFTFG